MLLSRVQRHAMTGPQQYGNEFKSLLASLRTYARKALNGRPPIFGKPVIFTRLSPFIASLCFQPNDYSQPKYAVGSRSTTSTIATVLPVIISKSPNMIMPMNSDAIKCHEKEK